MSSEIEKDLHFLKHLFAERFFNSNVYSLRRVFNHSKAITTTPTLVYTLRCLFKESFYKSFSAKDKRSKQIYSKSNGCFSINFSAKDAIILPTSLDVHCNDSYDNVNNVQDLFHDEESEGIYLYLSLLPYRYFPNLL